MFRLGKKGQGEGAQDAARWKKVFERHHANGKHLKLETRWWDNHRGRNMVVEQTTGKKVSNITYQGTIKLREK